MKEYWDLYDKEGNFLHQTILRGQTLPPFTYHLVVHLWIQSFQGRYLIQQRSSQTSSFQGYWSFTGGSALQKENSYQAIVRETQEELGIFIQEDILKTKPQRILCQNYILDLFYLRQEETLIQKIKVGPEVQDVKWVSFQEIEKMRKENLFWDDEKLSLSIYSQHIHYG